MTTADSTRGPATRPAASGWPVTTTESQKLFARANAVSPGGVQGEGRARPPIPCS